MTSPIIKLVNLKKSFDDTWITNGVTLDILAEKTTVIIGRSGEGKSVLLKQIIGLIEPTSGEIIINGTDVTKLSNDRARAEIYKSFGYVFQFAALLDSLTVYENVGIAPLEAGMPHSSVEPAVKKVLGLVNLGLDVLSKYPSEISGGMRKRVGLARTLISNPAIILYDEPTTGLDPITSRVIHELMYDMQHKFHLTSVVVSHDIEVFKYADYVALLHEGVIRYFGEAKTIWESDNPYIYQFIRGLPEGPMQKEVVHQKKKD
jgi:phospholipid/cholesterol/gamma-HCH transport system ATP-binding protein